MSNSTIVVVAALSQEFSALRRHLRNESVSEEDGVRSYCGELGGKPVALVVSGVGAQNAARATRLAIKRHSPGLVISLGYAGGLTPEAGPGRVILPALVKAHDASDTSLNGALGLTPDAGLLKVVRSAASQIRHSPLGGTILTVPAIVATREAKKALHANTGAVAVDMESAAIGAACRDSAIRVVFMRCITDGVNDEIPATKEISAAFRGRIRILPFLAGLARRPAAAVAIWRLFWRAHRASKTLSQLVQAFCQILA